MMKNFKNYALALVALVMAGSMTLMSFKKTTATSLVSETWYFQGGDPTNPDHYSNQPVANKPCGELEEVICQITAPNSSGKPNMSALVPDSSPLQTVAQQIADAVASTETNETVLSFREE